MLLTFRVLHVVRFKNIHIRIRIGDKSRCPMAKNTFIPVRRGVKRLVFFNKIKNDNESKPNLYYH